MALGWGGAVFDENTDPQPLIWSALESARPAGTLHNAFPWVPAETVALFVANVVPLQNPGNSDPEVLVARSAPLEVLVARFAHTVRAAWADAELTRQARGGIAVRLRLWRRSR